MVLKSAIREISAARSCGRIATGAFLDHTIQVWDLSEAKRLAEFNTVFEWGGRLTLNPTGELCAAAAYGRGQRGGVACYDALTGSLVWHRTDIRGALSARFSSSGDSLWCGIHNGRLQRLDPITGATVDRLTAVKSVIDSPYSSLLFLEASNRDRDYVIRGAGPIQVPKLTFGLLDAVFTPDALCLTEAGGPVRWIDTQSGEERWRYQPPEGTHMVRLGYYTADRSLTGVLWEYSTGRYRLLVRLSEGVGQYQEICPLDSWDEQFCMDGAAVVTSSGDVISVKDGKVANRLPFPQREYPS